MSKLIGTNEFLETIAIDAADRPNFDTVYGNGTAGSGDTKSDTGFEAGERPPAEIFNYLFYEIASKINYLMKRGVSGWNSTRTYNLGDIVSWDKKLYAAKTTNINRQPPTEEWLLMAIDDEVAKKAVVITAGGGLTGGGDLSTNRTLTLGAPETITKTTTNTVNADSHSHALNIPNASTSERGLAQYINSLGTSTTLAATQALVNTINTNLNNAISANTTAINNDVAAMVAHKASGSDHSEFYQRRGSVSNLTINENYFFPGKVLSGVIGAGMPVVERNQITSVYINPADNWRFTLNPASSAIKLNGRWRQCGAWLDGNDELVYSFDKVDDTNL
jgi:hypothetical protein